MEKNCSTCKHSPVDEHCKGCRGEKDGNTHWELEELDFSTPKKVVGNLISVNVLDKIRSEIETERKEVSKKHSDYYFGLNDGLKDARDIIDYHLEEVKQFEHDMEEWAKQREGR